MFGAKSGDAIRAGSLRTDGMGRLVLQQPKKSCCVERNVQVWSDAVVRLIVR